MAAERLFRRRDGNGNHFGPWLTWVYDARGERQQRSTRCHDRTAAEAIARQWEREAANPGRAKLAAATLAGALNLLLTSRDEGANAGTHSAATVAMYRQKAARLCAHFGEGFKLEGLDAAAVDGYVSARRKAWARAPRGEAPGRRITEHTIHKELVTLRAALKLAKRAGEFAGDLAAIMPVGFGQGYTPRSRALARAELPRLLAALEPDLAALVAFIVGTSARLSEALAARREDLAGGAVRLRGTKTAGAARTVPVVGAARALVAFAREHGAGGTDAERAAGTGPLFRPRANNLYRDLAAGCRRAGIDPVTPNDLRRTFATWLREAGADPALIAPAMGHVDSRMVERVYGRIDADALGAQLEGVLARAPGAPGSAEPLRPAAARGTKAARPRRAPVSTDSAAVPRPGDNAGERSNSAAAHTPAPSLPTRQSGHPPSEADEFLNHSA